MALDAVDHFLMSGRQARHEQFLLDLQNQNRNWYALRERLADVGASNDGVRAILDALIDAYNRADLDTIRLLSELISLIYLIQAPYYGGRREG
jgi:hypothetical protein